LYIIEVIKTGMITILAIVSVLGIFSAPKVKLPLKKIQNQSAKIKIAEQNSKLISTNLDREPRFLNLTLQFCMFNFKFLI